MSLAACRRLLWLGLAWLLCAARPAHAHDPFDGSVHLVVFPHQVRVEVTLGFDAAREVLAWTALTPDERRRATRAGVGVEPVRLAPGLADRVVRLEGAGGALAAQSFMALAGVEETRFVALYARPPDSRLRLHARYLDAIGAMRPGPLLALDAQRRLLSSTVLSRDAPSADVALVLEAAQPAPAGFTAYFRLGVEHILGGFDHLLFLCVLLAGVLRIKPMLGIVTAFTLAHSVTLALAALGKVTLAPAIVEPLIALSIIVAAAGNMLRREAGAARYWMAAGFGLIHGFGFAGALRDTGLGQGGGIAMPLFSFNLGVEAGQLLVAAAFVPLLLLARRAPGFARYGMPALSTAVILVSGYWLAERMQVM